MTVTYVRGAGSACGAPSLSTARSQLDCYLPALGLRRGFALSVAALDFEDAGFAAFARGFEPVFVDAFFALFGLVSPTASRLRRPISRASCHIALPRLAPDLDSLVN